MEINRIDQTDSIVALKNTQRVSKPLQQGYASSAITVSDEVKTQAELQRVRDMVMASPNVRADRLAELRAKIDADPNYWDKALDGTADAIIAAYRL